MRSGEMSKISRLQQAKTAGGSAEYGTTVSEFEGPAPLARVRRNSIQIGICLQKQSAVSVGGNEVSACACVQENDEEIDGQYGSYSIGQMRGEMER